MDVFHLRENLVDDYASYVRSLINIAHFRIRQKVDGELNQGLLWPDPLIQPTPSFAPGAFIDELVADGTLHSQTAQIPRRKKDERQAIWTQPPDILLTNYVVLELILTRPEDRPVNRGATELKFLVLDEWHTYRGRQKVDLSMLVRRTRDLLNVRDLQRVGTSATLAGGGTYAEQRQEVAKVASQIFGSDIHPDKVIGETLTRTTPEFDPNYTVSPSPEACRLTTSW